MLSTIVPSMQNTSRRSGRTTTTFLLGATTLTCLGLLGCDATPTEQNLSATTTTQSDDTEQVGQASVATVDREEKPPASPRSSHDRRSFPQGPHHKRPIREVDGMTLLWAGVDPDTGESIWFDMTDARVDPTTFQYGIGKDRIPSIDDPTFVKWGDPALERSGIGNETDVIGYVRNGVAKAYPIFIMDGHEVVNDTFGDDPLAVYW